MELFNQINDIFKNWNPIGVRSKDLEVEYVRYIDEIIKCAKSKEDLKALIEDIEGKRIGFFYTGVEDRESVVNKILKLFKN